jgi:uncharacterized protein (DUF58 family)
MEIQDILAKVRKIEIRTKVLTNEIFAGQYHSAFKGHGMVFSEVREYIYGDDIRTIDWNVTARFNHPYVKVYEEERELTVILMIDVSGSQDFGATRLKKEYIAELSAILAFSALENGDKVGVIFFSDRVEKFIPPQKGRRHILRIIREILTFRASSRGTNINEALKYLTNAIKKRAIVFMISDFIDNQDFEKSLLIASRKHDIIALKVNDDREREFPKVGLLLMKDLETGHDVWVDTSDRAARDRFRQWYEQYTEKVLKTFKHCGVDHIQLFTGKDFVKPLIQLFKSR